MLDLSIHDQHPLHIDIKAEMTLELAQLQLWLGECVIDKRTRGHELTTIIIEKERQECLGPTGEEMINSTAQVVFERIWSRRMNERWVPKSAKSIEREKNPKKVAVLAVKPLAKNHYIPLCFIRDHWTANGMVSR